MSIYTTDSDRVIAFNANNWSKRWCVRDEQDVTPVSSTVHNLSNVAGNTSFLQPDPPAPPLGFNQPTEANGVIYVGSENGNTYAFKASDGTLLWQQNTGFANASAPTVENGTVYIGSSSIYALNALNGAVRWKYPTSDVVTSSPVLVNGVVYVSSYDGHVYALDAVTGNLRWRFSVDGLARIYDTPTVANGVVYFGTGDGYNHVYAVNAANGKLLWRNNVGPIVDSSATVVNGIAYIGTRDGLYALNVNDGSTRWLFKTPYVDTQPAFAHNILYFSAGDGVYAIDASDATLLWHNSLQTTQATSLNSPMLLQGDLYIASYDGSSNLTLYMLNTDNGVETKLALLYGSLHSFTIAP